MWLLKIVALLVASFALQMFICVATPVYNKSYTLLDETAKQRTVGNVLTDTGLKFRYTMEEQRELTYRILPQASGQVSLFGLDPRTGALYTTQKVDRDQICPGMVACHLTLDIMIVSNKPNSRSIVKVNITIQDINDNPPRFPVKEINVNISEQAQIGSEYIIPGAEDIDSPKFGVKNYQIESARSLFSIRESRSSLVPDLHLVLGGTLDREKEEKYELSLLAIDGGSPPKSGAVTVNVYVIDANDNRPVFSQDTYTAALPENLPPLSLITQVSATDIDSGLNGQIEYSFQSKTQQQYGNKFSLDKNNGELLLKSSLDYNDGDEYVLSVVARDKGPNGMPAYSKVVLTVTDINNHAPQITRTNHVGANASVLEGSQVNRVVSYLTIRDLDTGVNGQFHCKLDTVEFDIEHVYGSEYQIITLIALNREHKDMYSFVITCKDKGIPSLTSNVLFSVEILDINDNKPIFYKDTINSFVNENAPVGTSIATVLATDADISLNGEVRYKVALQSKGFIRVNEKTGVVTTNVVFDYEKVKNIRVHVIAFDMGRPSLSSVAVISLTVLDTNDHKPMFKKPQYALTVPENDLNGTVVGHVQAEDKDTGRFSEIKYSLLFNKEEPHLSKVFTIDPEKGTLFSRKMLDHEQRSLYTFRVRARNIASPYLQSIVRVTVYVSDENDNSPLFTFPRPYNNSIKVSGVIRVGQAICKVRANDKDGSHNGRVSYAILNGNNNGLFHLNPVTGALSIARDITGVTKRNLTLQVVAKDHGYPQRVNVSSLHVFIDDKAVVAPLPSPRDPQQNSLVVIAVGCVAGIIIIILVIVLVSIRFFCKSRRSAPPVIKYHAGDQYSPSHDVTSSPIHQMYGGGSSGYVSDRQVEDVEISLPTEFKRRTRLSLDAPPSDSGSRQSFQREVRTMLIVFQIIYNYLK